MFGSMHRVRRDRRNRTEVTVKYTESISQAEIYYEMYLKELRKRRTLQYRITTARDFIMQNEHIPQGSKKALKALLKI